MFIDVRWLILVLLCGGTFWFLRRRCNLAETLVTTATVAGVLVTIFFFVNVPVFVRA
jgi:hypothetical protein